MLRYSVSSEQPDVLQSVLEHKRSEAKARDHIGGFEVLQDAKTENGRRTVNTAVTDGVAYLSVGVVARPRDASGPSIAQVVELFRRVLNDAADR